jgi:hypothetical protein
MAYLAGVKYQWCLGKRIVGLFYFGSFVRLADYSFIT